MRAPTTPSRPTVASTRPRARARVGVVALGIVLASVTAGYAVTTDAAAASPGRAGTPGREHAPRTRSNATDRPTRRPTAAEARLVAARPYTLHVPPSPADPAPLVIVLHGYGANGAAQAAYFGIAPVTDAHGMLLAIVDGTRNRIGQQFWNATDACCAGTTAAVDDSAYLRAVIADVSAHHHVDPRRIYLLGHSNGGFMSYRMACDHASVVAAIVSLEAATWNDANRCHPSQSVAVLEIHGTGDKTIGYRGGAIRGHRYPSAHRTVRLWAGYDGCRATVRRGVPPTRSIVAQKPARVTVYGSDCRGNGHVELWTVPGGPHIPPLTLGFATQVVDYLLAHPKR